MAIPTRIYGTIVPLSIGAGCVRGCGTGVAIVIADQAYAAFKKHFEKDKGL